MNFIDNSGNVSSANGTIEDLITLDSMPSRVTMSHFLKKPASEPVEETSNEKEG